MKRGEALYFTHGDPVVAEAIVGHPLEMRPATLFGASLEVQHAAWMPDVVQRILAVNRTREEMNRFGAFVARPRAGAVLAGHVTSVSALDLELFDNYELAGLWTTRIDGQPVLVAGETQPVEASMHLMGVNSGRSVNPEAYFGSAKYVPQQLNPLNRTLEIAGIAREAFLAERGQQ